MKHSSRLLAAVACAGLLAAPGAAAASVPIPISPGGSERPTRVESRCPTFSWTAAGPAYDQELFVYVLDAEGEIPPEPVLARELPGSAASWTPTLEACLEPGSRYAWLVRARHEGKQRWSAPLFLETAPAPSAEELFSALAVVRRYAEQAGAGNGDRLPGGLSEALASLQAGAGNALRSAAGPPQLTASGPSALSAETTGTADGSTGVRGVASGASGDTAGVVGIADSATGAGVYGLATATTGSGATGVVGEAAATGGTATGVHGQTSSPAGYAVRAANLAGGVDLLLDGGSPTGLTESSIAVGGSSFDIGNATDDLSLTIDGKPVVATTAACTAGMIPRVVGGAWTCSLDVDTDTTYTAGAGLDLDGTEFKVAAGSCADGAAVVGFDGSGVVCGSPGTGSMQVQAGTLLFESFLGESTAISDTFSPSFASTPVVSLGIFSDSAAATAPSALLTSVTTTGFTGWAALHTHVNHKGLDPVYDVGALGVVNGKPAMTFSETGGGLLYLQAQTADGSDWTNPSPPGVDGSPGGSAGTFDESLAIISGRPAISYYHSGDDLKFALGSDADGSSFGLVTVDSTGDVGAKSSLAVVDGRPAISYLDRTNSDLLYVRAADATGSSWPAHVVVDGTNVAGLLDNGATSLSVVDGNPAIAYVHGTDGIKFVRASSTDGSTWSTSPVTVAAVSTLGSQFLDLAVVNGNPAIAYWDDPDLKFVRASDADGTSWGAPVTVASGAGIGLSLAIVDGNPALSYHSDDGGVDYARATDPDGATWGGAVTVDPAGGLRTVLAVVGGQPAVGYLDDGELRFSRGSDLTIHWMAMEP